MAGSLTTATLLLALALAPAASAQSEDIPLPSGEPTTAVNPERSFYLGVAIGGAFAAPEWGLKHIRSHYSDEPQLGASLGLRIGGHLLEWLAVEVGLALIPHDASSSGDNLAVAANVDLLGYITPIAFEVGPTTWTPYGLVGMGTFHNIKGGLGRDTDFQFHLGAGLRVMAWEGLGVRLELRDYITDGLRARDLGNVVEVTLGAEWHFGGETTTRVVEVIHEPEPEPPPAPEPAEPTPAPEPDSDGDGLLDRVDKCPNNPGPARAGGCQDGDGDSVADAEDECPGAPGTLASRGCPDRDGDATPDKDDACPGQAGPPDNKGCLPEAVRDLVGMVSRVEFVPGSSKLTSRSRFLLKAAIPVLTEHQKMRVRIEGHTDSRGSAEVNQRLSETRANAVKDYLVKLGIDAGRLEAVGFGPSRPIADNKSRTGRAINRRVELVILE